MKSSEKISETLTRIGESLIELGKLVEEEPKQKHHYQEGDRLLGAKEAAKLLSTSRDWLYRNAPNLPFTRKLGPKMLRFSYHGIQKYLATRKF